MYPVFAFVVVLGLPLFIDYFTLNKVNNKVINFNRIAICSSLDMAFSLSLLSEFIL